MKSQAIYKTNKYSCCEAGGCIMYNGENDESVSVMLAWGCEWCVTMFTKSPQVRSAVHILIPDAGDSIRQIKVKITNVLHTVH